MIQSKTEREQTCHRHKQHALVIANEKSKHSQLPEDKIIHQKQLNKKTKQKTNRKKSYPIYKSKQHY